MKENQQEITSTPSMEEDERMKKTKIEEWENMESFDERSYERKKITKGNNDDTETKSSNQSNLNFV